MNMSFGKRREIVKYREAWRAAVHRTAESDIATEQQPHTSMLKKEEKNTPKLIIYSFYTCIKCFKWKFPFLVLDSPRHGLAALFQSFIGIVAAGFQAAFCPLLTLSLIRFQLFC